MRRTLIHSTVISSLSICTALSTASVALAVADLSEWVGVGNTAPANNYVVTSPTSAGGTFAERRLVAASLSDQTLTGGPFDWFSPLSMSGTVQFTGGFDPVTFFGWYNTANLNQRIGIGVANPVPAGGGIRWQTQSGSVSGTTVNSQNVSDNTSTSTFAPGTYTFNFAYDGLGHMTGDFGGTMFARNYALPNNTALNLDRFGFLQKSGSDDNVNTFTLNVSNITYTGETPFVPSTDSADFNGDDIVDGADFLIWQRGLGGAATPANGNANGDGAVDGLDLGIWRSQFGTDPPAVAVIGVVPEPSSALLLVAALAGAGQWWMRRKSYTDGGLEPLAAHRGDRSTAFGKSRVVVRECN
ncbi:MAG: PEP-CTERM sorting domain-containing protein [Pirellulales bacterium]|nr:PEP-CTERM sorting domain-containing protein [Pirellulales bacterium]